MACVVIEVRSGSELVYILQKKKSRLVHEVHTLRSTCACLPGLVTVRVASRRGLCPYGVFFHTVVLSTPEKS